MKSWHATASSTTTFNANLHPCAHNNMKRAILATIIAILAALSSHAGTDRADTIPQPHRPRVAVVLSGGGAKGMAHIGALRVIERAGIPIDIITGTSMGSIVGGLYAVGYNSRMLDSLVRAQDWTFLLSDKREAHSPLLADRKRQNTYALAKTITFENRKMANSTGGLIEGKNLAKLFGRLTASVPDTADFSLLPIPFACVATNIIDNTEYDFHCGNLAEAMRASMSIPGAFTPIRKGDMVLVDGGLRNNFPVDIARQMGADYVIGVTVQGAPKTADDLRTSSAVLSQIVDVNCKNKYDANLAITDIPIRVNTRGYSSASFTPEAIDTLIRRGEAEAIRHWDELMALKRRLGLNDDYIPHTLPAPVTAEPSGTDPTEAAETLQASTLQANLGIRFDTEEMVALQLSAAYSRGRSPFSAEATLRLGKRITARGDISLTPFSSAKMLASYIFHHTDLNVYHQGDRDYNITFNHHEARLAPVNFALRNLNVSLGARFDYYRYTNVLASRPEAVVDGFGRSDHLISYYAEVAYNSENKWTFPTRGANFSASYLYSTDNFTGYNHHRGFSELAASWRMSFPLSPRLTLQPMAYGRLLFGSEIPAVRRNVVGGEWFGHYIEQQMPFAGIGYAEYVDNQFIAIQLKASQRIATNNYVELRLVGAQHADRLGDILSHGPMMGYQAAYYYDSLFGPLGATLGYSGHTEKPYFYINLGFEF